MPTLTSMIAATRASQRAIEAWKRINEKPTSIAFKPPSGAPLAAQTIRLEYDNRSSVASSAAGAAPQMHLIVFGIKSHPTVAATIMEEGFRFVYLKDEYRIQDVIETLGERQGVAIATG